MNSQLVFLCIRVQVVIYLKFLITIIKHTEIYVVEKLEMLMLYMYHMGDLTSEKLALVSMVLMCGFDSNIYSEIRIHWNIQTQITKSLDWSEVTSVDLTWCMSLCMMRVYCVLSWLYYDGMTDD